MSTPSFLSLLTNTHIATRTYQSQKTPINETSTLVRKEKAVNSSNKGRSPNERTTQATHDVTNIRSSQRLVETRQMTAATSSVYKCIPSTQSHEEGTQTIHGDTNASGIQTNIKRKKQTNSTGKGTTTAGTMAPQYWTSC